ncbi:MCE family protein [Prauserella alba]|uniref:MCE family protein n=1 Tax=Prauserella alba TaxID=176898 RepID=A0ABN1V453_9PSEU|nr:MCE family protein [Prauserella alba]MCP2180088.1 phospholipid/cholesterol/gamma-HCH transport system substrate-binding protein [Prauserella alba]
MSRLRTLVSALTRRGPVFSGVAGALVLALLVASAVAIPQLRFHADTAEFTAEFGNAAGLAAGDQVHVAGVPAGRVVAVDLAGNHVDVRFRLDEVQPLGSTSSASVKLATVLGTRYLAVQPRGAGELADATIPRQRTSVPYSLGDLAGDAHGTTEKLDTAQLRSMISTLSDAAPDGEVLGDALRGIRRAARIVGDRGEQFQQLLGGIRTLTSTLAGQRGHLTQLLGDAELVAGTLSRRRETIRTLVREVDTLTAALEKVIRENQPAFSPLLSDLHSITTTLKRHDRTISRSLAKLGPVSRYVTNATGNGPWGDVSGPDGPLPDNLLCVAALVEGCR